jgi:hypothetical protein
MPQKEIEADDPMELVGIVLPADAEANREMAYVFAEEFARLGYDRGRLLWLFKTPFYGGAHGAYRVLGEKEILSIIDECVGAWGGAVFRDDEAHSSQSATASAKPASRRQ